MLLWIRFEKYLKSHWIELVTWEHLIAREAGKCSLAMSPGKFTNKQINHKYGCPEATYLISVKSPSLEEGPKR